MLSNRDLQYLFWYLLPRSHANLAHGALLVAYLHSTRSTYFSVRCPATTHVSKWYETTRVTTERKSGVRAVRDTHHASRRQCCRIGTCSSCFGTGSLARQCYASRSLGRIPIFNTINHTALYAIRLPFIFLTVTKMIRAKTERGCGEPAVRDIHHAN